MFLFEIMKGRDSKFKLKKTYNLTDFSYPDKIIWTAM